MLRPLVPALALLSLSLSAGQPQFPPGTVIPRVSCVLDPSTSYALYLPSGYTPTHAWPIIFAFDPGGRGLNPVERYRAAAEQYGFIVAGSNDSRNGSNAWAHAVMSMANDLSARFAVNPKRTYTAGMSGGARVALAVAIESPGIAGVIASSAGFPDSLPRKAVPFPIFATAGTEDFNHLEMLLLDRELTTPHRLVVFEGGHTWPSSELITDAIGWLELQAMRSGLAVKDVHQIDTMLTARLAVLDRAATDAGRFLALQTIVADFEGLTDVSAYSAQAAALAKEKTVKDALKRTRDEGDREIRLIGEIQEAAGGLGDQATRQDALVELDRMFSELNGAARRTTDSMERRVARRLMATIAGNTAFTTDPDLLKLIAKYRVPRTR